MGFTMISSTISSNIKQYGYDGKTRVFRIEFKNGANWEYLDVPPEKFVEAQRAESLGRYLSANVIKAQPAYESRFVS